MKKKPALKQSPTKQTRAVRRIVLSLLAVITVGSAFYAVMARIQYYQKIAIEDITFTRIETYVNTAKAYLESELPNGGWQIEKYCDAPNTKGSFDEYACVYSVVATHNLGDTEVLKQIARSITGNQDIYIYSNHPSFSLNTEFDPKLPKSCGFYSWEQNGKRLATITCDSGSIITRYKLRDI